MLLSILVPTYREAENIKLLCESIAQELQQVPHANYEILIMDDDSQDGSEQVVQQLQKSSTHKIPVSIINRKGKKKSLSAAVIDGFAISKGEFCCVMDADLSHPPSAILPMVQSLQNNNGDFCLGSRYTEGGSIDIEWTLSRRVISLVATLLAMPLCRIKDPMSGFFAIARKDLPPLNTLSPVGYKIALELMVKGNLKKIIEYPIHFSQRIHGDSKMDVRQQFFYLRHLRRLYQYKFPVASEFVQFGMVGGSGFIVDVSIYYLLQYAADLQHTTARALSFWAGASWNWYWNRKVTFSEYFKSHPLRQWASFVLVCVFGFTINWGCYYMLTEYVDFFSIYKIFALMAGVIAGMGFNFMFSRAFIFRHI